MSGTRINQNGEFKQERWASSAAFDRPLKANLVASRVSLLKDAAQREIIWFLQYLSLSPGGLRWAASEIAPESAGEDREKWVAELCLNPETGSALELHLPRLRQFMADYCRLKSNGLVTAIGQAVGDGLEYCSQTRGLVLISGKPRLGKTWAAQAWIKRNPGRARYVQIPSDGSDATFFGAIARALGLTVESDAKVKYLCPRVEAALQGGDLMLVLDEAMNLWPNFTNTVTRPSRISWIMCSLVNRGLPVALLVTPQFQKAQSNYVARTGWACQQFDGRISRFIQLPDKVEIIDLEAVAQVWLPDGDRRSIQALADFAFLSNKGLAAIEHVTKLAAYNARQDGREKPVWPDIARAIKESPMPDETDLAGVMRQAAGRRKASAMMPRE
jgi:hypothetical protein